MRVHRARIGVLVTLVWTVAVLAAPAAARADAVTDWDQLAAQVLTGPPNGQGSPATAHLAMLHAAVFDAVNAIDHRYTPYLTRPRAKPWFSQDAAVTAAAHRVLVSGHVVGTPEAQAALETAVAPLYDSSLAAIPDGAAKSGGVATGEAAGWAMIAARTGDGRFGPPGFTLGPPVAGAWRPTPPGFINDPGAWLKDVTPFLVRDPDRFRSRGPNALTSRRYAEDYAEVKSLGQDTSTTRTADQTTAARFWGATNAVATWSGLIRTLAEMRPMSTVDRARFYALVYLTGADTLISVWRDKDRWQFWRPVTAIRLGDTDGNPATVGDAGWLPLITTPPYPDHPSGLSAFGASNVATLQELFGTDKVAFGGVNAVGVARNYTRLSQAIEEIVDARVWSGIHFRHADNAGARIGREVARWRRDHPVLRPLHR